MSKAKKVALGLAGLAVAAVVVIAPHGCSREPQFTLLPVGKTISIMPASIDNTSPVRTTVADLGAVHLTLNWGGRAPKDSDALTVRFYRHGQSAPFMTAAWSDLLDAWKTSGCTNDQVESLDGQMVGVALICDGRIKASEIEKVEASDSQGKTRSCTTISTYQKADDVTGAVAQLY